MTTDNKAMANSDPLLRELDTLLAAQGKLQFAREDYDEAAATVFGVALLDFMRVHGMEVRRRIVGSAPVGVETVDSEAWLQALELPEGYEVAEHLPGIWQYEYDADGNRMASGASWNHPALAAIAAWQSVAQQPAATPQAQHPDDVAVDAFADAMKQKLAEARAKGRGGWQNEVECPHQRLSDMLRDHVAKGDPRDVANFACFLWNRGESIAPEQASLDVPSQYCYSPDHGDSWYDSPADADILDWLDADHVGATFELQVSHWSVTRTFRVTKVADETGDDYQVEPVAAAQQVAES